MKRAPLLTVQGIDKAFSGVPVLRKFSLDVAAGEVIGLIGENGSGKSTAMNIIAGILTPDAGRMEISGAVHAPSDRRSAVEAGVAFIQQELNIFPTLSVAENLFLGRAPKQFGMFVDRQAMSREARRWLESVQLDVSPNMLAGALSAGERQLLEIARGLASGGRIMIFDEPTSSLTPRESERLFGLIRELREQGVAIIFISHALEDVLRLSDRVVVMRDGAISLETKASSATIGELVRAMVGRDIETLFPPRSAPANAQPLLSVTGLGARDTVADIAFTVGEGEIVGFAGLMGAGRTELARLLFGLEPHDTGTIKLGGVELAPGDVDARLAAGMAFLTEDRRHEGVLMEASVADNFELAALPKFARGRTRRIDRRGLRERVHRLSRDLSLKSGPLDRTPIRNLSGGNQQKVLLGRWMLRQPKLLIVDEPTRGVDIGAKQDMYRLLADLAAGGAGVLLISSEIEEVIGLCDRALVMRQGRIVAQLERHGLTKDAILAAAFGQRLAA